MTENPLVGTIREIIADAVYVDDSGRESVVTPAVVDVLAERVAAHFRAVGVRAQDGSLEERFFGDVGYDAPYWVPVFVVVPDNRRSDVMQPQELPCEGCGAPVVLLSSSVASIADAWGQDIVRAWCRRVRFARVCINGSK
jgi:hypothetical protein